MQITVLALLLAAVFGLFVPSAQSRLRGLLHSNPRAIWAVPFLLTCIFAAVAALVGAFSFELAGMLLGYTLGPVACVYTQGAGSPKVPGIPDFLAIVLLWLPLEFAAGGHLVPRPAQGFLHSVAYGIAILLGLVLFIGGLIISLTVGQGSSVGLIFGIPLLALGLIIPMFMMRDLFKNNEVSEPCPNCGASIKTSDATLQLRCPSCHKVINVRESRFYLAE